MKISYQWLNDYLKLDQSPEQIEEALTLIGFEVEGIETVGLPELDQVVVGEVLSREQHPNADRLGVCRVKVSEQGEPQTIVCGASNYQVGDRIPVALPGAVLPGGFKIKSSKLRGVKSDGMMCSPRELGMGEDHAGLWILDSRPEIGTPINVAFPERDVVFDIEVTPNRPDCLSHIGIARELGAYFNLEMCYPEVRFSLSEQREKLLQTVDVQATDVCPNYQLFAIQGVTVKESPDWLKKRLQRIGLRPINNVVDVTNYVLHELGQPLHAFDADKIRESKLVIRQARNGEKIVTLDEKERTLQSFMTVIADGERPLVVAGVMGSVDAEVDEETQNIVLEVAWFQPSAIRQTSRRLGLSTDSSYRFERGVDPAGGEFAAGRALDLILELAGGTPLGGRIEVGHPPATDTEIVLNQAFLAKTLGFSIPNDEVVDILERLEFSVHEHEVEGELQWRVEIPTFRLDLERPVDLVEEILRIYGTSKIPPSPVIAPGLLQEDALEYTFRKRASEYLVGQGFQECLNYTLRSELELSKLFSYSYASSLKLENPLAQDQTHLRPSLLLGLFDNLRYNLSRGNAPVPLFETGKTFKDAGGKVFEMVSVAFAIYLPNEVESWRADTQPDYYSARRWIEELLGLAGVKVSDSQLQEMPDGRPWSCGHSAVLGDLTNGWRAKFGFLGGSVLKQWDIPGRLLAGALHILPESIQKPEPFPRFQPFSAFPKSDRDISLLVDQAVWSTEVESHLAQAARSHLPEGVELESIALFDLFTGKGVPEGQKSLTYRMEFRSSARTLTDAEVSKAFQQVVDAVNAHPQYTLRSNS